MFVYFVELNSVIQDLPWMCCSGSVDLKATWRQQLQLCTGPCLHSPLQSSLDRCIQSKPISCKTETQFSYTPDLHHFKDVEDEGSVCIYTLHPAEGRWRDKKLGAFHESMCPPRAPSLCSAHRHQAWSWGCKAFLLYLCIHIPHRHRWQDGRFSP